MRLTRRSLSLGAGAAALARFAPPPALAAEGETESHGLAIFGDLKYGPGFRHFDYVEPQAPKGGAFAFQISSITGNQNFDTFNTLNIFVLRGDGAAGMWSGPDRLGTTTFDSLMARAFDEPDAMYGLVAAAVRWSGDGLSYRFRLRPEARFHDGSKITARDVAFSLTVLKEKGHPRIAQTIRLMLSAEAEADDVVVVKLAPERSRDLPLTIATLPIFSQAYYRDREFDAATLEAPLGSGPYKVGRLEVGRFIEFDRVADYWGRDLPVNIGHHNFARIRYEYYRDRDVAFEAFKAGAFTYREEFTSRIWNNGYDFQAVKDGRVRREILPDETPSGMQGWWLNTRREKFGDPRVREAIGLAFDFEWTNVNLMYSAYRRTASFFENSDMRAEGRPGPEELALLEPWRGTLPEEVFGEPYTPPRSDGSGQDRNLLRRADQLLREAGCRRENNVLKLPGGQPLEIEFLDATPSLQPHTQPFIKNLGLLGIQARSRIVDAAQYQRRENEFDFDVVSRRYAGGMTPGEPLRQIFASRAAAIKGSQNLAGIAHPAVDGLLESVIAAKTRDELRTACRALDRVLRAGRYWVPMWYSATHRVAYWDMFGRPASLPRYEVGAPAIWWHDADKAKRIGRA
ncbi:MAG TPA: extracellular solute-binding protein [Beijerinckiaceae bacterium]